MVAPPVDSTGRITLDQSYAGTTMHVEQSDAATVTRRPAATVEPNQAQRTNTTKARASAAGFLCLNALAHGRQLFFQIRSVRRRLKARFAYRPSGTRTEGRVARHFTRFQISRMLPRRRAIRKVRY